MLFSSLFANEKLIWIKDKKSHCNLYIDKYFVLSHSEFYDEVEYYIGTCKNGKVNGFGVAIIDEEFILEGEFQNGKMLPENTTYHITCVIPEIEEDEYIDGIINSSQP